MAVITVLQGRPVARNAVPELTAQLDRRLVTLARVVTALWVLPLVRTLARRVRIYLGKVATNVQLGTAVRAAARARRVQLVLSVTVPVQLHVQLVQTVTAQPAKLLVNLAAPEVLMYPVKHAFPVLRVLTAWGRRRVRRVASVVLYLILAPLVQHRVKRSVPRGLTIRQVLLLVFRVLLGTTALLVPQVSVLVV